MTYTKTLWVNNTTPSLNATNLNNMEEGIYEAHRMHRNLIAGVTATLSGWTVDPTDEADITDDDISTACTTGNKVAGSGYQYGIFEWAIGSIQNILCTGFGNTIASAGTARMIITAYNGTDWNVIYPSVATAAESAIICGIMASAIRLNLYSTAAATITPNIREFAIWGLK